jgi:Secretion system C-terminal sorting domain
MVSHMKTTINAHPNPFLSSIRVEVTAEEEQHNIIRLFDATGKFIRIISWKLRRGTNISMLNNLDILSTGSYFLDIIDHNAHVLHKTEIHKQ